MKRSFCSFFFKFVFIFSFSLLCLNSVSAKDAFTEIGGGGAVDIFSNCNALVGCAPLCVYSGPKDGDQALIGYHFDTDEWEIAFSYYGKEGTVFHSVEDSIPTKSIYWGSSKNWYGSEGYNNLSEKLICPTYFYPDIVENDFFGLVKYDEVCFAYNKNLCNLHVAFDKEFSYPYTLLSSFVVDFNTISKKVYDEMHFDEDINLDRINKVKFVFNFDDSGTYEYDEAMSPDYNVKTYCEHLKNDINDLDMYISNLLNSSYYSTYKDLLTSTFERYIVQSDVTDAKFYKYENLRKIMVYQVGNELKYRNSDFEKLDGNALIYENLNSSFKYISSVCDVDVDDEVLKKIDDKIKENWNSEYKAEIVFEDQYDCSFLSGIADLIGTAYFIIEMLAVIIFIAFSILDYVKVIMGGEADELKKANSKFLKRIVIMIVIFLLPSLVNFTLKIFKIEGIDSENPLCVKISNR